MIKKIILSPVQNLPSDLPPHRRIYVDSDYTGVTLYRNRVKEWQIASDSVGEVVSFKTLKDARHEILDAYYFGCPMGTAEGLIKQIRRDRER